MHSIKQDGLTHVSLFTGIGGLDLAAEAAGFETVLQVEREPYALRVLERHWPNVPRITDVREVISESVSVHVTVVSGGFPCQPFSAAGKRRGADDDRYLWPELLRIVEDLRPSWVVGENVSGLLSIDGGMEIDRMLAALEVRDYEPWILHYPAAGVGAPHRRDRVFIVAYSNDAQRRWREKWRPRWDRKLALHSAAGNLADAHNDRLQARRLPVRPRRQDEATAEFAGHCSDGRDTGRELLEGRQQEGADNRPEVWDHSEWWAVEPDVGRVADGVPHRVDRLRALGNAVVPAQAYPIFAAIARTENI